MDYDNLCDLMWIVTEKFYNLVNSSSLYGQVREIK